MKGHKRKKIGQIVRNMLWLRAAGRCEFRGCNKCLWLDKLTKNPCNLADIAHIVSDSPDGPRGDEVRSPQLAGKIENLMLLCRDHHKIVDSKKLVSQYPESLLQDMKKAHESRIKRVTDIKEEMEVHTVYCSCAIDKTLPQAGYAGLINHALMPNYYPAEENPIEIAWTFFQEGDWKKYWEDENRKLVTFCKERVLAPLEHWKNKRIALFAIGPMPLLVKLGSMLNDKMPVDVYQKHRDTDSWDWGNDVPVQFIVNPPDDTSKDPALVFSLSYDITDRVRNFYGANSSIWEFRIDSPNNDFLKSRKQLADFRKKAYEVLDVISHRTQKQSIKVFMSMPVACAVELGRVRMPKADLRLDLYDYNRKYSEKDEYALTIG